MENSVQKYALHIDKNKFGGIKTMKQPPIARTIQNQSCYVHKKGTHNIPLFYKHP